MMLIDTTKTFNNTPNGLGGREGERERKRERERERERREEKRREEKSRVDVVSVELAAACTLLWIHWPNTQLR